MRKNGANRPFRVSVLTENRSALSRVLFERWVDLEIEIVNQPHESPIISGLAELFGIGAHCRFDGKAMSTKTLALHVFGKQSPNFVPGDR